MEISVLEFVSAENQTIDNEKENEKREDVESRNNGGEKEMESSKITGLCLELQLQPDDSSPHFSAEGSAGNGNGPHKRAGRRLHSQRRGGAGEGE